MATDSVEMAMRINQILATLEVGHEVDTAAKVHSFVFCEPVSVANSWQKLSGQYGGKTRLLKEKVRPVIYFVIVIQTSKENFP